VLKVFRSRTPSVIQSLVLVYSRLINNGTTQRNCLSIQSTSSNLWQNSMPMPAALSTFSPPSPSKTGWASRSSSISGYCSRVCSGESSPSSQRTLSFTQFHGPLQTLPPLRQEGGQLVSYWLQSFPHQRQQRCQRTPQNTSYSNPLPRQLTLWLARKKW